MLGPQLNSRLKPPPGIRVDPSHSLCRDLVAAWPLNEGAGSVVNDISRGNISRGRTGQVIGGGKWKAGQFGSTLELDGSTGYISLPAANYNFPAGTVSWWMFPTLLYTDRSMQVLWDQGIDNYNHFTCLIYFGNIYCGWYIASTDYRVIFPATTAFWGCKTWTMLTFTWSLGSPAKLYRNGLLYATASMNTDAVSGFNSSLLIGVNPVGMAGTWFAGAEDLFLFYQRALPAVEVWELYSNPFLHYGALRLLLLPDHLAASGSALGAGLGATVGRTGFPALGRVRAGAKGAGAGRAGEKASGRAPGVGIGGNGARVIEPASGKGIGAGRISLPRGLAKASRATPTGIAAGAGVQKVGRRATARTVSTAREAGRGRVIEPASGVGKGVGVEQTRAVDAWAAPGLDLRRQRALRTTATRCDGSAA